MTELSGDALFEALGDEVFKPLSFLVDFVPRVVEHLVKEGLNETMMADDLKSALLSGLGELDAVVLLVRYERCLLSCELLEHVGH